MGGTNVFGSDCREVFETRYNRLHVYGPQALTGSFGGPGPNIKEFPHRKSGAESGFELLGGKMSEIGLRISPLFWKRADSAR